MADLDDNRQAAVLRVATCACWLLFTGCHAPLALQSVVTAAPPAAFGVPAAAAGAAAAGGVASAATDARPSGLARAAPGRDESGHASGWPDFAAGRAADDFAVRGDGGRLNLYVDPLFAWAPQPSLLEQQEPQEPPDSRWSDFLPLGRAQVLAAGYELPRAFGVGIAYTRLRRDIEVDAVRVGIDGGPPQLTNFLAVEADSVVDNVMARLDAWIFPFWNVSVLGGWTWNESTSDVTVSVPFPVNPRDVTLSVPTHQDGPTWGFGTNLAAGYGEWFISGDATWIFADMQDFALIEGFLGSLRSGWHTKIDGDPVRFWGGVTYWDTATTVEGDVVTGDGTVHFEVEQGPVTPYSLQVGASVDFGRATGVMVEGHLLRDVQMLVVSAALRF